MWFEPKEKILHSGSESAINGQIFDVSGKYGALRLQVTGITSATITFEQSNDGGTTWDGIAGTNTETGVKATTATANGTFLLPITGVKKFRARISTYATGTIYVYAMAIPAIVAPMEVYASLVAGTALAGKVGIDQATANANEVVVKSITAGDNNIGNVDIASALPAGTALLGKVGIDQATANANEVVVKSITAGTNNIGDVDIASIPKGTASTVHTAITTTTTSAAVTCIGFNAVMVTVTIGAGGGTWKIDVMGCNTADGTFVDIYDNYDNQLTTGNLTASRMRLFVAVSDYIKIEATEVVDGSACTVEVQPMNV